MRLDDTIAAIATPIQASGLGVIRVSGTQAVSAVDTLFKSNGKPLRKMETHKLVHGWITDNGELIDKVLVVVMCAPHSYTTEDVVEIQCHGSPFVMRIILDLVLQQDVRLADAGEFTHRAFLHGRLDLTQVEAISDLIHANSEIGAKLAAQQLRGKLFHAIDEVKKKVVRFASLVEASIEFPEEGQEFPQREECMQNMDQTCEELERLLYNANLGRKIRDGFDVVIIGCPNVGKSSLLNTLLCEQRAIVTTIPGTTRDTIEESLEIKGIAFHLTDTAGIRKTEDLIENEGIRRAHDVWKKADLVLLILDASEKLLAEDLSLIREIDKERTIVVLNKRDLLGDKAPLWYEKILGLESVLISAKTGEGCEEVKSRLFKKATLGGLVEGNKIWITNRRQQQAAKNALSAMNSARECLNHSGGEELIAVDLRSCLNALGEIVGKTTPDDLLGEIFSEFCIGK